MTDELDEILRDYTPNLTSEQGDPDAYDAEDCIEYPHSQTARRNDTHDCLTCGQPECKPWYKEKQAIQALIDRECNKAKIEAYEDVIDADAMSFRNQLDFIAEDFAHQRIAELSNKENTNE